MTNEGQRNARRRLTIEERRWPMREPFVIARGTDLSANAIVVTLTAGEHRGRGEAIGVDYHDETPASMTEQIGAVRAEIEKGASREDLLRLLPAGGARNAVDAALWDLEAREQGRSVWDLAGVAPARSLATAVTIGIRSIPAYEERARELKNHPWLKVKVWAADPVPAVAAVRRAAPKARLIVDANQAWTVSQLRQVMPDMVRLQVSLLEQPVPGNLDAELARFAHEVPICADEPVNTAADLPRLIGRYDYLNIKLDKCGGLTEGLTFARAARAQGFKLMVGCMAGGSIAMAPGMVLGQLCELADLDGPLLQSEDWPDAIEYHDGVMTPPSRKLWGNDRP